MLTPKPFQERTHLATIAAINSGGRRILIQSPTGTGKSFMMGRLAQYFLALGRRVIVYTNRRSLLDQSADGFSDLGIDVGVRAAGHENRPWMQFQISSLQTEVRRLAKPEENRGWTIFPADVVIIDECFTADTLILTPRGPRRIDNMRPGDTVYCATGIGVVQGTSCRPAYVTYRIEFSNETEVECTGNHPFFTITGWRTAQELDIGEVTYGPEAMRVLWQDLEALAETKRRRQVGGHERGFLEPTGLLRSILCEEARQSHEQESSTLEDESHYSEAPLQTDQARWERAATHLAAASSLARSGGGMGGGGGDPHRVQPEEQERLSNLLQNRHREHAEEDRNRSQRGSAQHEGSACGGSKENCIVDYARVVRVTRLERTCSVPVFNLHVSGHPSYFANGRLVHNCHLNAGPSVQDLAAKHINMGAVLLGYTATPVDVGHMYDQMIQCCTMQEGRESGLLVKMLMFGPDEPDLKAFGKVPLGADISLQKQSKAIMTPTIFGRVFDWWKKLNPDAKPTLGFAPGIQESIGFVEDWRKRGVRTAHIDGDDIYIDGAIVGTDTDTRRQIFDDHKKGRIACIWNRFVLREGIDLKWSAHGILAVTLGSLQTYIQTVGRFARSAPGKDRAVIQDHGGNYWRHGSPNAEREWRLEYTSSMIAALWEDRHRTKRQKEGYRCPGCSMILAVKVCPNCGHTVDMSKRPRCVIQVDGTPKMLPDKWQYKERRISVDPGGPATWKRYILYRFRQTEQNFRQAEACYMLENGYCWPDRRWPYMPIHEHDFFRKVKDVPVDQLRSE